MTLQELHISRIQLLHQQSNHADSRELLCNVIILIRQGGIGCIEQLLLILRLLRCVNDNLWGASAQLAPQSADWGLCTAHRSLAEFQISRIYPHCHRTALEFKTSQGLETHSMSRAGKGHMQPTPQACALGTGRASRSCSCSLQRSHGTAGFFSCRQHCLLGASSPHISSSSLHKHQQQNV